MCCVVAAAVVVVVVVTVVDAYLDRVARAGAGILAWKPGRKVAEAGTGIPDTSWRRRDGEVVRRSAESATGNGGR